MAARIFLSYRAADGADKATALARDLGRAFGDAAVFLDKDDLTGGRHWADEVGQALGRRPVVLLLVTPRLLADGLDQPGDPVRRELAAALAAGAEVLPLLCDGVEALPPGLPPPLDALPERTWRRLRAYDWAADLQRLVQDLQRLGVPPATGPRRRALGLAAAGLLLATGGAGLTWWLKRPLSARLAGRWRVQVDGEPALWLTLVPEGATLRFASDPIDIRERADWADYRAFWRERFGQALEAVRYRGEGRLVEAPGSPPALDLGFKVLSLPQEQEIDGGNLSATLQPDGGWRGTRWLNGAQAERPAVWTR